MKVASLLFSLILPIFIYAGPVITSVSPSSGPVDGGNLIEIMGSGFTGATAVNFGTLSAAPFATPSDTNILLLAPETMVAGTIDVTVTTASGTSSLSAADEYTYTQGDWYLYASTNLTPNFRPLNLRTNLFGTLLTLQDTAFAMSITPDGQSLFGTHENFADLMHVDLSANQDLPTIPAIFSNALALSPDGKTAYMGAVLANYMQSLHIATQTLGPIINLPDLPLSIAITPDGKTAYVSTPSVVYPVNLSIGIVGSPFSVPGGATIQITPDGTKAFVSNSGGPNATYIDLIAGIGYNNIAIGANTRSLAINPDGKTVYFLLSDHSGFIPVDVATMHVGMPVTVSPFSADQIGITPDGKTAYLACPGAILSIDLINYAPLTPVILVDDATIQSIAISPDQAPIASFIFQAKPPGLSSTFDASASFSPVGFIAKYDWDFGDGTLLSTDAPITAHVYESSGTFTVTLTVTNSGGTSTTQTFTGQMVSNDGGPSARTAQDIMVIPLYPPEKAKGVQIENHFFTQTEIRNKLVWNPPSQGTPPVAYKIYSDAGLTQLVAIVPAGVILEYVQHNVYRRAYTYYIVTIDASGNQSAPVTVIVRPAEQ